MLNGVQLSLLIGLVPFAAPRVVIEALREVTVTSNDVGHSGFQLDFELSTRSPLHTIFLLSSGASPMPLTRVIVVVTINSTPHVLMDGMVTNQQVAPAATRGQAALRITGEDLSVVMDKLDFSGFPFPAVPAEGRVALLVAKYAFLGLVPLIIPSVLVDVPIPTTRIPAQRGTDLAYIRELARDVGYVFYIDPGPLPGANIAYWGPQLKVGVPQPALNLDMDAHSNVERLTFTFDNNLNAIPTVFYYDEITKATIVVPIPPITPLNPPLGLIPPIPTRLEPVGDDLSKRSLPQGIMIGLARAAQLAEAVSGEGELDVVRYGRPLQARRLVGVRGAGPAFDGLHYVKSVTSKIRPGQFKQSFTLSRNGLLSTLPRVPV